MSVSFPNLLSTKFTIFVAKQKQMSEIESGRIHATKILAEEIKVGEKFIPGTNIVIPSVVKESHLRAKVVMVGSGTPSVPVEEKVGETVIFSPHAPLS